MPVTRRIRSLLLVFTALLGLLGQQVAWATVVPAVSEQSRAVPMPADCQEEMQRAPTPKKMPCNGSLDCMMAMGCMPAVMLRATEQAVAETIAEPTELFWPDPMVLSGGDVQPELDPPTISA